jgi:hypothetical protein
MNHLNTNILNKSPWSLIRLGDGGLKFIHSYFFNDDQKLDTICRSEGIPKHLVYEILELWKFTINSSDYCDSPEVYFSGLFWNRLRGNMAPMSKHTIDLLARWRKVYSLFEIHPQKYCNPEINFLSCLDYLDKTLVDIIAHRKIAFITHFGKSLKEKLQKYCFCDVDIVEICGKNQNQFLSSFSFVLDTIKERCCNYDLWLVSAGELGRIYTGYIKEHGGRCFDVGSLSDYWSLGKLPIRLSYYMTPCEKNNMLLTLKPNAEKFKPFI